MSQIEVKVKLDLPAGVELLGYERCGEGHRLNAADQRIRTGGR